MPEVRTTDAQFTNLILVLHRQDLALLIINLLTIRSPIWRWHYMLCYSRILRIPHLYSTFRITPEPLGELSVSISVTTKIPVSLKFQLMELYG